MLFTIYYFGAAALAGSLAAGRMLLSQEPRYRILAALTFGTVFLLVPFHLLGWLELIGILEAIRLDHLAVLETAILAAVYLITRKIRPLTIQSQSSRRRGFVDRRSQPGWESHRQQVGQSASRR